MSRYSIVVKDFKVIKQARVDPEGITLVWGANSSGKSTLGKALVSLLSNQHSEENFRHGQSSYAIGVRVGEDKLVYARNGDVTTVKFNDEAERQKLGRAPMSQVEPRFLLKRYDYEDSSFFPNFSFQNEVPLFGDISIYALFSSMFASIAKVSERVTACQTEGRSLSKKRDGSLASSETLKEKVSESSKALAELQAQFPNIGGEYQDIKSLVERKRQIDVFLQEYAALSVSCQDPEKLAMAKLYDEAQSLFPEVMLVEKAGGVLAQLDSSMQRLGDVYEELGSFPDILLRLDFQALIAGVGKLDQLEGNIRAVRSEDVPDVPVALVEGVGRFKLQEGGLRTVRADMPPAFPGSLFEGLSTIYRLARELDALRPDLDTVLWKESEVRDQLRAFPCERLVDGLCPYQDKLVV